MESNISVGGIIEITETKKKQKRHYSGKKKQHTLKTQVVIDQNQNIICV
ncbi:MAG TPA: hypothetical protein EYG90_07150, partial [Campylobacterales bacterium]|nr:hypothetical protein [Campylobacterales bacterium]